MTCGHCFVDFAMPRAMQRHCESVGAPLYCPAGHKMTYHQTELDRVRMERDRYKQQVAERDDAVAAAERETERVRKEAARVARRVHNGVCPCCNRSFANVARHMKTKHPDVVPLPATKKRA